MSGELVLAVGAVLAVDDGEPAPVVDWLPPGVTEDSVPADGAALTPDSGEFEPAGG